jgi:peroxiredoxin Q/BCP
MLEGKSMENAMPAPQVNDVVEDFTTQDQDGNTVSLSDFAKTPVVLFFYPRADTPGCTTEACSFRDAIDDLKAAGVTVLGISRDTVKAQKKFAEKFSLKYPLLADPDETICDSFGVIKPKNMYGKLVKGIERTTYLIGAADKDGKQRVLHIWSKVKPEGHAEEVLEYLKLAK